MRSVVRPAVELLAGIPSVVYGFFGVVLLRPIIGELTGSVGFGPLTAWIVLAIMIVPTIAALSEDALNSIPMGIREASYAMGATQWQTIYKVVVPAAKIGIIDAIILGMGRAIGETMAVLMLVGNAPQFFAGVGEPISTLTSQIVMDMGYSTGTHRTALFGMAAILFVISMSLVLAVRLLSKLRD
jgi:phosphate transport system permease protein